MDIERILESAASLAQVSFSRSGGPGGQNVNKVNTKVELRVNLDDLDGLNPAELQHLKSKLAHRLVQGAFLLVVVSEERTQGMNRELADKRLKEILREGLKTRKKRKATTATKASKERRLAHKKRHGEIKRNRSIDSGD